MDKKERSNWKAVFYIIGVLVSLFALYTFLFVIDMAIGWKIFWSMIGFGWLFTAVTGLLENIRNK